MVSIVVYGTGNAANNTVHVYYNWFVKVRPNGYWILNRNRPENHVLNVKQLDREKSANSKEPYRQRHIKVCLCKAPEKK